jgi:hypothetical protein
VRSSDYRRVPEAVGTGGGQGYRGGVRGKVKEEGCGGDRR